MGSALAIAATTFLLKDLLENDLIAQGLAGQIGEVAVTALAPDRVSVGADERNQLNLFLYRVTPHAVWRGRPGLDGGDRAATRGGSASLSLELHYLLSAYGEHDFHAELLLGVAMRALHRALTIATTARQGARGGAVAHDGDAPLRAALAAAPPRDDGAALTITTEFLSSEETSKLWSALQERYRPSATYKVSAVLLDGGEG